MGGDEENVVLREGSEGRAVAAGVGMGSVGEVATSASSEGDEADEA